MLTLRSSPASPFVRKIRIAANVLGLDRDIAIGPADTMNPSDSVRAQNPLGKIPALLLEDGTVLFDSRVILEYLDHRAGGSRIIPHDADARFSAFRPRSRRPPMWVRSRSLARSAIAISASREPGGAIIRGWSPGSTNLPRACRPSPPPSRRARPVSVATR